jgi:hypothetical protein
MPARILKGYDDRIKNFKAITGNKAELVKVLNNAHLDYRVSNGYDFSSLAGDFQALLGIWKEYNPYINAAMDQKLGELFKPKEGETEEEKKRLLGEHEEYYKALDALRRLYDRQEIQPKQRPWQY